MLLQEPLTFAVAKEREQREHQVRRGTITLAYIGWVDRKLLGDIMGTAGTQNDHY